MTEAASASVFTHPENTRPEHPGEMTEAAALWMITDNNS